LNSFLRSKALAAIEPCCRLAEEWIPECFFSGDLSKGDPSESERGFLKL
jgi:hypothetical protein